MKVADKTLRVFPLIGDERADAQDFAKENNILRRELNAANVAFVFHSTLIFHFFNSAE